MKTSQHVYVMSGCMHPDTKTSVFLAPCHICVMTMVLATIFPGHFTQGNSNTSITIVAESQKRKERVVRDKENPVAEVLVKEINEL
jgi:hypothetical protein